MKEMSMDSEVYNRKFSTIIIFIFDCFQYLKRNDKLVNLITILLHVIESDKINIRKLMNKLKR